MAEGMAIAAPAQPRVEDEVQRGPTDVTLLFVVGCLVSIGLLAVYNGSALKAHFLGGGDDLFYLERQAIGAMIGLVAMAVACRVDYRFWQRNAYWVVGVSLAALALTAIPIFSVTVNGATRWARVAGLAFQPAELAKVATVIYLAYSVAKKGTAMANFVESFVAHGLVFFPFIVLLMMQPDLGTSIVICAMVGLMMFVGGARIAYMMGFGGLAAVLLYAAISGRAYRLDRIRAWLDPWEDPSGVGYHLVNSYVALARGGLSGTGFGEGGGRLGYIPELYNDFVAASVGEEFGLVGLAVLAVLYVVLIWRGMVISRRATDAFGSYLAFGLTVLIGMQAAFNLCVVTGVVPTKGLTLPFVSYGRTSLIVMMFAVGILLNIAQRNPDLFVERRAADEAAAVQAEREEKTARAQARRQSRAMRSVGADV